MTNLEAIQSLSETEMVMFLEYVNKDIIGNVGHLGGHTASEYVNAAGNHRNISHWLNSTSTFKRHIEDIPVGEHFFYDRDEYVRIEMVEASHGEKFNCIKYGTYALSFIPGAAKED